MKFVFFVVAVVDGSGGGGGGGSCSFSFDSLINQVMIFNHSFTFSLPISFFSLFCFSSFNVL